jgi:hypothetical protein
VICNVSTSALVAKYDLFNSNQVFLKRSYRLFSQVSLASFQDFVSALEDRPIEITIDNYRRFSQLCREFGFQVLASILARSHSENRPHSAVSAIGDADVVDQFTFIINVTQFDTTAAEAIALSPSVRG